MLPALLVCGTKGPDPGRKVGPDPEPDPEPEARAVPDGPKGLLALPVLGRQVKGGPGIGPELGPVVNGATELKVPALLVTETAPGPGPELPVAGVVPVPERKPLGPAASAVTKLQRIP